MRGRWGCSSGGELLLIDEHLSVIGCSLLLVLGHSEGMLARLLLLVLLMSEVARVDRGTCIRLRRRLTIPVTDEGVSLRAEEEVGIGEPQTHLCPKAGPGSVLMPIGIPGRCTMPAPMAAVAPPIAILVLTFLVAALLGSRWKRKGSSGLWSTGSSQSKGVTAAEEEY